MSALSRIICPGSRHGGIKGVGENPSPARVPVLWAGGCGRMFCSPHSPSWISCSVKPWTQSLVGWMWRGSLRSLSLIEARDNRFSVSDNPDAAVCHWRAENTTTIAMTTTTTKQQELKIICHWCLLIIHGLNKPKKWFLMIFCNTHWLVPTPIFIKEASSSHL